MFARLLRMQIKPESIDEATKLFSGSVIPKCGSQKGFQGAIFLADRNSGRCIPITFWETEADALATEENRFFQEQLVKFMGFFTAPPIREGYEVVFQKT